MSSLKRKSAVALAWDFGGLLVNRGSGFIISIFLARLLSPEEFGLVGMAMVFIVVSQVFTDVGFSSALIQRKENSDLTYNSVFYFNIFAGFCLTLIFYFIAPLAASFYEIPSITSITRWLSLSFILNSFNQVQSAILNKELNFKVLTFRSVVASMIGGILGVIAAIQGLGVYALVVQSLSTAAISTILLWSVSKWRPSFRFSIVELQRLLGFSSYVFFDRLISKIFNRLDIMLIGKLFTATTLGYYTRAVSLQSQVSTLSSASIAKVFFPVMSDIQLDSTKYKSVYFKLIAVIAFLSYLLSGVLYVMGEDIIINIFGAKWEPSVDIFKILILAVCNFPFNSMMINALMGVGKSKENFNIGLIRKAIKLIPLIIAFIYGFKEFIIAVTVFDFIVTGVNIFFLNKYLHFRYTQQLYCMYILAIPLFLLIVFYHFLGDLTFFENFGVVASYTLAYVAFSYIIKFEGLEFLVINIKKIVKTKYTSIH